MTHYGFSGPATLEVEWKDETMRNRVPIFRSFSTSRKQVLTSEGSLCSNLEIRNILLADKVDSVFSIQ